MAAGEVRVLQGVARGSRHQGGPGYGVCFRRGVGREVLWDCFFLRMVGRYLRVLPFWILLFPIVCAFLLETHVMMVMACFGGMILPLRPAVSH